MVAHRDQPRDRVRAAQRPLRAPHAARRALLPRPPHRRPHEPRHQRPLRGAHGAGARASCTRRARSPPSLGTIALMARISPRLLRARRWCRCFFVSVPGALLRPPHPRPLRGGAGAAREHQRAGAGEPRRARAWCAPTCRRPHEMARFEAANQEYLRAQPRAHPHVRQPLSRHPAPDGPRARCSCCGWAGAWWSRARITPRRVRGLRRLPRHAALADDRARLGGEPLRARRGLDGPHRSRSWTRRRRSATDAPLAAGRACAARWSSAASPSPTRRPRRCCTTSTSRCPRARRWPIVGPTGSGKSTLVSLIPRLYEAPPGTVLVDGHDVRDLPLAALRGAGRLRAAGDVPLLRDACARTWPSASRRRRPGGRVRVGGAEWRSSPRTWPTSRRATRPSSASAGITLSGGQKQRTALARALAVDPRILILDDALSSVDTQTEEEILRGPARRDGQRAPPSSSPTASRP